MTNDGLRLATCVRQRSDRAVSSTCPKNILRQVYARASSPSYCCCESGCSGRARLSIYHATQRITKALHCSETALLPQIFHISSTFLPCHSIPKLYCCYRVFLKIPAPFFDLTTKAYFLRIFTFSRKARVFSENFPFHQVLYRSLRL